MKKIILTLLVMVGFIITASAQNRPNRQHVINERKRDRMEARRLHRMRHRHHRRRHHRVAMLSDLSQQQGLTISLFKPQERTAG